MLAGKYDGIHCRFGRLYFRWYFRRLKMIWGTDIWWTKEIVGTIESGWKIERVVGRNNPGEFGTLSQGQMSQLLQRVRLEKRMSIL